MILVIVCDGANAKFFVKEARFTPLQHLTSFNHTHELTHEHGRDKPGRGWGTADHHAYEPKTDWHESQKEVFAREISSHILEKLKDKNFSKLYFISPPKLATVFRTFLDQHMDTLHKNSLEIKEIHKDLVHSTTDEIEKIVQKEEGWQ
jgi:protein required for attachment to host cells